MNCPQCGGPERTYANFGTGVHMVSEAQLNQYKGPVSEVSRSIDHTADCQSVDAFRQRAAD